MGEAWSLRASTLCVLLTTTGGYAFLPQARPLAPALQRGRHCNSAAPRARCLTPFCAVAVDRGTSVSDDKGDTSDETTTGIASADHAHDDHPDGTAAPIPPPLPPPPPPPRRQAAAAGEEEVIVDVGSGDRYSDSSAPEEVAEKSPTTPHQSGEKDLQQVGGGTSEALPTEGKVVAGRITAAAAAATTTTPAAAAAKGTAAPGGTTVKSKTAKKPTGKRTGRRPSKVGKKGPKGNPSIGKSKLDLILGDTAKTGVLFGGEERAKSATAVAGERAAKDAALAKAAAEATDVDDEEMDDYEQDVASLPFTARWRRRVVFAARTVQIWAFLFHVLVKLLRQKLVQMDEARMSARRRKLGRYLCKAFLKLGPTFIKIGQLLSTRVDLLSTEYIEELQQLQDNVPGFGGKKAIKIIEKELGAPITELFDSFNSTSLAAASLGQVHEAWLDGKRYAVKVQRPGLKKLFEVDLNSIGALAGVLDRYDPKLDGASRDWGAIFRESSRVLYEEVDYMREGKNAERFSENFKDTEWIKAPSINWSRSSGKVLCMEYVQGIKINDVEAIEKAGVDRKLLATRTAECYLEQLIRHGFFHCDPHPGNLACDAVGGGRIIFYDFGMMDELTRPLKRSFSDLIFGIYGNNLKEVVDSLEEMDVIRKGADRMTVERVTRFYLGEFQTTLTKGGKYINQMDPEEEKALIRRERAQIGQDLFSGQAAIPLQFPASFTFVFRAFTTLDGIGKTLDSGYDLTKIAGPYLKELLDLKDGNVYVSVLKDWQRKLGLRGEDVASVVQSPRRVQHVDKVVTKLEEGDLKLRVRVLESEAAFARIEAVQGSLSSAVMATLLLNAGVVMAGGAAARPTALVASRAMFAMAGFFGLKIPVGYFKVWQLNRQANNSKGFR